MDVLKKIGNFLLGYYDKLVLGILLIWLAAVMIMQAGNMQATVEELAKAGPMSLSKNPLAELTADDPQFNIKLTVNPDATWQPAYNSSLDAYDARDLSQVSIELREFIAKHGEGALFDPPVYVYSSHDPKHLVHFHTGTNPFTSKVEGSAARPEDDGDDTTVTNPEFAKTPQKPFITYVYVHSSKPELLPLELKTIQNAANLDKARWQFQVDVFQGGRKYARFPKIGELIEGTEWKVVDATNRGAEQSITIERGDERIVLPKGKSVSHGATLYTLAVLPPNARRQRTTLIESVPLNKPFAVTIVEDSGVARREYYKFTRAERSALIAVKTNEVGEQISDSSYEVVSLTQLIWNKYLQDQRAAAAAEATVPDGYLPDDGGPMP